MSSPRTAGTLHSRGHPPGSASAVPGARAEDSPSRRAVGRQQDYGQTAEHMESVGVTAALAWHEGAALLASPSPCPGVPSTGSSAPGLATFAPGTEPLPPNGRQHGAGSSHPHSRPPQVVLSPAGARRSSYRHFIQPGWPPGARERPSPRKRVMLSSVHSRSCGALRAPQPRGSPQPSRAQGGSRLSGGTAPSCMPAYPSCSSPPAASLGALFIFTALPSLPA